jgi:hypothetical protein
MANLFILIKCKKIPQYILTQICYPAVNNHFLWIGSNIISNYHILHYKGPLKKVKLFKREVTNILQIAKNKNFIKCYSVLTGNTDYFIKPSEHDYSIDLNPTKIVSPNIKKKIKFNINKFLLNIILKLKKTKYGYYLPLLIVSKIKDHPIKVSKYVFIVLEGKNIIIYGNSKTTLRYTKLWLSRVSKLLEKINC